ncbi:MAG TPA: response regulator transcription factor [Candidatus Binatia bacterium]|jgi:DNA-binding NarL/FixJ family response regulator|nr:response regulator transcription factor [Candidatus Binatia bacterium]
MGGPLRIVVADDHALFRQGLRSILELHPGVTVVAEIERVADLAPVLARTPCDVLLLDLQMERSALTEIEALGRRVPIVVVTASERPADALAAVRAGARAIVFKRFAVESLLEALHAVRARQMWLPPGLQRALTNGSTTPDRALTAREREIVRHVALGCRNAEIGRRLSISEVTVKTHLNNVFRKLEVRDRVELTLYAIRTGLVGVDEKVG